MKKNKKNIFQKEKQADVLVKAIQPISVNTSELEMLLTLVDIEITERSPVQDFSKGTEIDEEFFTKLNGAGWMAADASLEKPLLATSAIEAMKSLTSPITLVQLILGSPKELAITNLYSWEGYKDGTLVLFHRQSEADEHTIHPGQSPSDVSDALLAHLLTGPHLEGLSFDLELEKEDYLVFLAILDLVYTRQLQAKLEGDSFPVVSFKPVDVQKRFDEIRAGEDLLWASVLVPFLVPYLPAKLAAKKWKSSVQKLADEGLLTPAGKNIFQPSEFTLSLADGLLPVINFGSCAIDSGGGTGMHTAYLIGLNVNLVIHVVEEGDRMKINLTGMDGTQLSRLLFEIGLEKD